MENSTLETKAVQSKEGIIMLQRHGQFLQCRKLPPFINKQNFGKEDFCFFTCSSVCACFEINVPDNPEYPEINITICDFTHYSFNKIEEI